eukprot:4577135-Amphidinium_carterae.1
MSTVTVENETAILHAQSLAHSTPDMLTSGDFPNLQPRWEPLNILPNLTKQSTNESGDKTACIKATT